ncbi:acetyl-CoA carboxyl transferase [Actinophytocola xinjiangensis]|uniref:Multifunctional fusion protein n=1 Tax=Actinophytocola xinjiangensis TaxID=485602 RepID=A0A7Z1B1B0_9PSEU|nr:acetyl-CoA carboxyl transferase [Actinophytocola xinjiangensis]
MRRLDEVAAGTWTRCPGCAVALHRDKLAAHVGVCPRCGHHFRLTAHERLAALLDPGSFTETAADLSPADPLGFVDARPYPERLRALAERTGLREAAVCGSGTVDGHRISVCVLDFRFQGGSMGVVVGEKVTRAAELALAERIPLVICSTSGGARMQEGIFSLLQMAKTAAAVARLRAAGVPFVSLLADPVYGGVSASFATLGDLVVAEPGARVGFAGPKVISQTIRQELPPGFQTSAFLLAHGHVDAVVPRQELRAFLGRVLGLHVPAQPRPPLPAPRPEPGRTAPDAWTTVGLARHPDRPHFDDYLRLLFDDFVELRGDRCDEDDPAVAAGLARFAGAPVVLIGHRKGRGTTENVARNFGMPGPAGYRKAVRLMRHAERFGLPVVTFLDTPGAYPGIRAEERNQSGAIAECLATLAGLRVPVIGVLTGEGGSGGALALGVTDRLLALEHAVYSVISPEGCATILFGDSDQAARAAAGLRLTARDLRGFGVVDDLLGEPGDGAHTDHAATAEAVRHALYRHLTELSRTPIDVVLDARQARFRGPVSDTVTAGKAMP